MDRLRGDLQQEGLVCVGDKFSGDNSRVGCKDAMANKHLVSFAEIAQATETRGVMRVRIL